MGCLCSTSEGMLPRRIGNWKKGGTNIIFCATLSSFSLQEFSWELMLLILIIFLDGIKARRVDVGRVKSLKSTDELVT